MKYALMTALIGALLGSIMQYSFAVEEPLKPGEERIPPNESQAINGIVEFQTNIMKKTNPHIRGQHPKAHGCVEASFIVLPDIPSDLKVGIFQVPKTYKALIRFSNSRSVTDPEPDVHGMAIKVSDVNGKKALPSDPSDAQDFILIDSPFFFAPNAETLLGFMMAKAAAQKDPNAIKAFAAKSPINRDTVERSEKIKKTVSSPLEESYWSTVAYKLGDRAVKYSAKPDNYLHEAIVERLSKQNTQATFNFYVQTQTDAEAMPIEDPTVVWTSPEVKVATILIAPQDFDNPERNKLCEESSFSPWHALDVHAPLGGINRARKAVYEASSSLRHQKMP